MGDDRPARYVETLKNGRPVRVVYRASSLGGCERAFVATGRGIVGSPHPDWLLEVFEEGNRAESQILRMWEEAGAPPTIGEQDELEIEVGEVELAWHDMTCEVPIIVRAHIDGRALDLDGSGQYVLRECKKFRDSTWPVFLSKGCEINVLYPWQLSAMMHAVAAESADGKTYPLVEMIGGHWQDDHVTEIVTRFIDNPPIPLKAIKKKVARIERLLAEGYDPTDAEVVCTENQYPCPFWKLHTAKPPVEGVDIVLSDVERESMLQEMVLSAQMAVLVKQVEGLKAQRNEHRQVLQAALVNQGVAPKGVGYVDGYAVQWTETTRKAHEVKESTSSYVSVKLRKGEK